MSERIPFLQKNVNLELDPVIKPVVNFESLYLFYTFKPYQVSDLNYNVMRNVLSVLFLFSLCLFSYSCKKETEKKYCWQIIDAVGRDMGLVCDKTEAELLECVNNRSCGFFTGGTLGSCFYYIAEGEEFCWLIDSSYIIKATENKLALLRKCFGLTSTAVKADCNYCQHWYHRKKSTYKPDGRFTYSPITRNLYCGDTTRTLYQGREIVLKNDADSLIVIQFSNDGTNW